MGIGDWGLGPIPNPQSPIPNPQSPIPILRIFTNNEINVSLIIFIRILQKILGINNLSITDYSNIINFIIIWYPLLLDKNLTINIEKDIGLIRNIIDNID